MQTKFCVSGSLCLISSQELSAKASHCLLTANERCKLDTQNLTIDHNCSAQETTHVLEGTNTVAQTMVNGIEQTVISTSHSLGCSGCSACSYPLNHTGQTYDKHDFRECVIRILWDLSDNPCTLENLKIGTIPQLRELLVACGKYAAEVGDVSGIYDSSEIL